MATVSEDGDSMMMLDESRRRITIVDLKSKGKTPPKEIQVSLQSEVDQVCLSAAGKHLITLERNASVVNVWRASDGTWVRAGVCVQRRVADSPIHRGDEYAFAKDACLKGLDVFVGSTLAGSTSPTAHIKMEEQPVAAFKPSPQGAALVAVAFRCEEDDTSAYITIYDLLKKSAKGGKANAVVSPSMHQEPHPLPGKAKLHSGSADGRFEMRWNPSASGLIVAEFDGAKPHLARYVSIIQLPDTSGRDELTMRTLEPVEPVEVGITTQGRCMATAWQWSGATERFAINFVQQDQTKRVDVFDMEGNSKHQLKLEELPETRNLKVRIDKLQFDPTGKYLAIAGIQTANNPGFAAVWDVSTEALGPAKVVFIAQDATIPPTDVLQWVSLSGSPYLMTGQTLPSTETSIHLWNPMTASNTPFKSIHFGTTRGNGCVDSQVVDGNGGVSVRSEALVSVQLMPDCSHQIEGGERKDSSGSGTSPVMAAETSQSSNSQKGNDKGLPASGAPSNKDGESSNASTNNDSPCGGQVGGRGPHRHRSSRWVPEFKQTRELLAKTTVFKAITATGAAIANSHTYYFLKTGKLKPSPQPSAPPATLPGCPTASEGQQQQQPQQQSSAVVVEAAAPPAPPAEVAEAPPSPPPEPPAPPATLFPTSPPPQSSSSGGDSATGSPAATCTTIPPSSPPSSPSSPSSSPSPPHTSHAPDSPAATSTTTSSTGTHPPLLATMVPVRRLVGGEGTRVDVDVWAARATGEGAFPAGTGFITKSMHRDVMAETKGDREEVCAALKCESDALQQLSTSAGEFRQHQLPELLHGRRHTSSVRYLPQWYGFLTPEELAAGKVAAREMRQGGADEGERMPDKVDEDGVCLIMSKVGSGEMNAPTLEDLARPKEPRDSRPSPLLRATVSVNLVEALLHIHRRHHKTHNDFHVKNVLVADVEKGEITVIDLEASRRMQPDGRAQSGEPRLVSCPRPPFTTAHHLDATLEGREFEDETVTYATDCMSAAFSLLLLAAPSDRAANMLWIDAQIQLQGLWNDAKQAEREGGGERLEESRRELRGRYRKEVDSIANFAANTYKRAEKEVEGWGEEAKEQNRSLRKKSQELYKQLGKGHADGMAPEAMWELLDRYRHAVLTELFPCGRTGSCLLHQLTLTNELTRQAREDDDNGDGRDTALLPTSRSHAHAHAAADGDDPQVTAIIAELQAFLRVRKEDHHGDTLVRRGAIDPRHSTDRLPTVASESELPQQPSTSFQEDDKATLGPSPPPADLKTADAAICERREWNVGQAPLAGAGVEDNDAVASVEQEQVEDMHVTPSPAAAEVTQDEDAAVASPDAAPLEEPRRSLKRMRLRILTHPLLFKEQEMDEVEGTDSDAQTADEPPQEQVDPAVEFEEADGAAGADRDAPQHQQQPSPHPPSHQPVQRGHPAAGVLTEVEDVSGGVQPIEESRAANDSVVVEAGESPAAESEAQPERPGGRACNRKLIRNAMQNVCLAGEPNRSVSEEVLQKFDGELKRFDAFVIVFNQRITGATRRQGTLRLRRTALIRVLARFNCPATLENGMATDRPLKYDTATREFREVPGPTPGPPRWAARPSTTAPWPSTDPRHHAIPPSPATTGRWLRALLVWVSKPCTHSPESE
ncbi:unnamed protein product [Vitrella brassicaformis CCMP3155]|uniref:CKK domain-containing protein n=1 Tax=Vitrella brassicaformis (strain CCMP3155) TaxID=1169540 RepID=A0A0G4G010_VITBC|nr:unnamed protein product [Vitrella brassicaformis CCMP3155]|eukprot:CEM20837.1 unnamed protein product [Vitrella brassicaformis CCMP3155]